MSVNLGEAGDVELAGDGCPLGPKYWSADFCGIGYVCAGYIVVAMVLRCCESRVSREISRCKGSKWRSGTYRFSEIEAACQWPTN